MSETWLIIGLFVLGVVVLFPVVMFVLGALLSIDSKKREPCPSCGQRRLRFVRLVRGRPRDLSFFLCESCGARHKQHCGGDFEIVSEEEWALLVDPGTLFLPRDTARAEACAELVAPFAKDPPMLKLNSELRFPKPPFRMDPSSVNPLSQDNAVSSYLDQIRLWRLAVLSFIDNSRGKPPAEGDGLTDRAQQALATFLASHWTQGMTNYARQSPYNIAPFPASALEAVSNATMESVLDVLRWRASVVDYLDDVYDVIGETFLNLFECIAIDELLNPACEEQLCSFCLTAFAAEQLDPDGHDCILVGHARAKWPPTAPIFAKWAKKARTQESKSKTDRLLPPAAKPPG